MALGTSGASSSSSARHQVIKYDEFVDQQVAKVRSFMQLNELGLAAMRLATLVVVILFGMILVDHWLVDLGRVGRCVVFALLLISLAFGFIRWVVPLLIYRINPVYAAREIEKSQPWLKNSLINFMLFRSERESIRGVVYRAVEKQAAADIARVDVDLSIDRTPVIRLGSALAIIMVSFAAYLFVSPKDPLQSIARVVAPWTDRTRPSRVRISGVEPKNITKYSGDFLDVSAAISRLPDQQDVWLAYRSTDGQVKEMRLPMSPVGGSDRWQATLPASADGLFDHVDYWIEAGDGKAGPYRVTVLPAPKLTIESVEYEYPAYTGRTPETVAGDPNIAAVEGTRVTIRATANQEINYAYLEFDPVERQPTSGRHSISMQHEGRKASVSFVLHINDDRKTPRHSRYRLRFANKNDEKNERAIVHGIKVSPDLSPMVEVLDPHRLEISVPADGKQRIQVRAIDPDYGVEDIRLQAMVGDQRLLNTRLLEEEAKGQVLVEYQFQPASLRLNTGDVVTFRALVRDNRDEYSAEHLAAGSKKSPFMKDGIAWTHNYRIRVGPPRGRNPGQERNDQQQGRGKEAGDEPGSEEDELNANGGENRAGDSVGNAGQEGDSTNAGDAKGNGEEGEQNGSGEGTQNSSGTADSSSQGEDASDSGNSDGQNSHGPHDGNASSQSGTDDSHGEDSEEPGSSRHEQSSDATGRSGEPSGSPQENGSNSDEDQNSDGANSDSTGVNSNPSKNNSKSNENRGDGEQRSQGESSGNGQPDGGSAESRARETSDPGSGGKSEPLPADGSRPGDVMERILDHIREKTGKTPENSSGDSPPESSNQDSSGQPSEASPGDPASPDDTSGESSEQSENSAAGQPDDTEGQNGKDGRDGADRSKPPKGESPENSGGEGERRNPEADGNQSDSSDPGVQSDPESQNPTESGNHQGDPAAGEPSEPGTGSGGESGTASDGETAKDSQNDNGTADGKQSGGGSMPGDGGEPQDDNSDSQGGRSGDSENSPGHGAENDDGRDEVQQEQRRQKASGTQTEGEHEAGSRPNKQEGDARPGKGASKRGGVGSHSGDDDDKEHEQDEQSSEGADPANVEYARKATDLVLDYLKDQERKKPDQELLDELGWTPEQLKQFLNRWKSLKQDEDSADGETNAKLDDALRSLGLRPTADRSRKATTQTSRINKIRDSGRRTQPPAKFRERYQRYLRSLPRAN